MVYTLSKAIQTMAAMAAMAENGGNGSTKTMAALKGGGIEGGGVEDGSKDGGENGGDGVDLDGDPMAAGYPAAHAQTQPSAAK